MFVRAWRGISLFMWIGLFVFGMFLSPSGARGQVSSTSSVVGTVRDSSGAVISAAHIVITQTDTGFSQSAESATDGSFAFPVLPVGPYRLEVKKEGFAGYEQTGIVLTVSQAAQLSVSLKPGTVRESIEVKATPSPVNTTTGDLSGLVDSRQMVDLPLNGRNPAELVLLAAGVANPMMNTGNQGSPQSGASVALFMGYPVGIGGSSTEAGALIPAVNGIRTGGVYFSLDGANNTDPYSITGGPFPNPDAVQEFRVMTNGYGAEYVSAPGGAVNIVTKSGTNAFHGDLFEFVRNGDLNARNFFAAQSDNIKRNQFGGTAGGPIRKDKFFIFGSYQGTTLRDDVGGIIQYVPTAAEREGDFSAISTPSNFPLHNPYTFANYANNQIPLTDFNPITNALLSHLPLPTVAGPAGEVSLVQPGPQGEKQVTVKADYLRGKQRLVGRYFYTDWSTPGVDGSLTGGPNWLILSNPATNRWQDMMIGHDLAAGRMVNQARLTYERNNGTTHTALPGVSWETLGSNVTNPPGTPYLQVAQVNGYFNIQGSDTNIFPRETWTASDRLAIVRGRHQISLGGEVSHLNGTQEHNSLESGVAVWETLPYAGLPDAPPYNGFSSGNVISDFVLGKQTVFEQADGAILRMRGNLWGLYGSDQIRVDPRLTVTLGLRWDPYWPFHSLHNKAMCFRPGEQSAVFTLAPTGFVYPGDPGCNSSGGVQSDLRTFQPRMGFAYRLDQKGNTSIRGGYGIYAMQFPMIGFLQFANEPPYTRQVASPFSPGGISNPWVAGAAYAGGNPFTGGFNTNEQPLPSNTKFPTTQASVIDADWKLASIQQWNLTLEHLFPGSILVGASYAGTKGTHLSLNKDLNAAVYTPGNCSGSPCSTTANEQTRRPYPALSMVVDDLGAGNSSYNALQLVVQRRMATSLTVSSNVTWAKSLDTVSSNANGVLYGPQNTVSDPFNLKAYRGLSDFDVPYGVATSAVYQLPTLKSNTFVLKHVLSRWMATAIWTWQGGTPFGIYSGVDNSLTGEGRDYADRVPGVSPKLNPDRSHGQLLQEYFNPAAFQQNAMGTFGNSGRNTLRAPGFDNVDFSVMKMIPLKSEQRYLTIRGEFFNIMNTPHFGAPNGAAATGGLTTPNLGQIVSARDPRIVQLAMKLNW
jgi:hypothetical protein